MDTLKRAKDIAEENGITLNRLAKECNINYRTFQSVEKRQGQLSVDTISIICSFLGLTLSEFFAEERTVSLL